MSANGGERARRRLSSDELRGKLARLRRETSRRPAVEPVPETPGTPGTPETKGTADVSLPARASVAARTVGVPAGLTTITNERGAFTVRLERFPAAHRHGAWALEWADERAPTEARGLATLAGDESLSGLRLRDAVYLDIETTGLSGGAGTVPFLVALGTFEEDEFHLWQGFLAGPEQEAALLFEVASRIDARAGLVSFFGKSFDRHRLEDKMRIFGVAPPFEGRAHLDLYHPLRRLYRDAFPDGRLATMETGLCGVERTDDLPGSFAPAAWYDFLAGRGHRLEAVFRHNRDDVLSLVTLAAHLTRSFDEARPDGEELEGCGHGRAFGLARLLADRGEHRDALGWIERGRERQTSPKAEVRLFHADLLRRLGRHAEAFEAYGELVDDGRPGPFDVQARIEMAKLAEHRLRDLPRAQELAEAALRRAQESLAGRALVRTVADASARIERIARKRRATKVNRS